MGHSFLSLAGRRQRCRFNKRTPERIRLSGERRNARIHDLRTLFSLAIEYAIQAHQRLGGACRTLHSTIPNTVAILAKIGVGQWHMLHRHIGHNLHPSGPDTFDKGPPSSRQRQQSHDALFEWMLFAKSKLSRWETAKGNSQSPPEAVGVG